jgi:hypothetical protein
MPWYCIIWPGKGPEEDAPVNFQKQCHFLCKNGAKNKVKESVSNEKALMVSCET